MINLNETPEAVHNLVEGEHVTVQGREFVVNCFESYDSSVPQTIYLTSVDSRIDQYNRAYDGFTSGGADYESSPKYQDYITHVRNSDQSQAAAMTRDQLVYILKAGAYAIG